MKATLLALVRSVTLLLVAVGSGTAQEIHEERVDFAPGASAATFEGSIEGHTIVDYGLTVGVNGGPTEGQGCPLRLEAEAGAGADSVLHQDPDAG